MIGFSSKGWEMEKMRVIESWECSGLHVIDRMVFYAPFNIIIFGHITVAVHIDMSFLGITTTRDLKGLPQETPVKCLVDSMRPQPGTSSSVSHGCSVKD